VRLGERLGLEGAALEQLRYGAVLHDVGMLGVPDSIVRKKGLLDNEETAIMRQHTVYGYELLSPVAFLHGAVDVTLHHHERWDGRGYPGGLKETEIPRAARIFAVIDIWDALLSPRPQRPAWAGEQTLAYVQSMAGSHCDPEVVKAFVEGRVWEER
jgi:HD-GYP domain-containing protein (c-di-GMP phosphodiesterase class II)